MNVYITNGPVLGHSFSDRNAKWLSKVNYGSVYVTMSTFGRIKIVIMDIGPCKLLVCSEHKLWVVISYKPFFISFDSYKW